MANLLPFIKCTSPIAIHRGSSIFLYPCRKCECCQVSRQKSLSTMLALEESHAKYCYFINPTYNDFNIPAVRVPDDADFGSIAEFEIITPRLKRDKYFEPYIVDYDVDLEKSIGQLCEQRDEYSRLYSRSHKFVPHDVIYLLHYPDIQRFIKRFRIYAKRKFNASCRYYVVGEYGTNSLRPHWHLLLFFDSDELAQDLERCYHPRTKNSGKTLTSDFTTTTIVQSVYVRFGSSVLRLVNVQTNPLITMFPVMLRALLAFPSACRLYQDPTRCTLVSLVRLWQKKRFNEQLSLRTSNISEFIIVTLAKAIRFLMPFGGRITLDSSPSSLDLLICLMKKYFVYLSTGKKSVSSPVTIE